MVVHVVPPSVERSMVRSSPTSFPAPVPLRPTEEATLKVKSVVLYALSPVTLANVKVFVVPFSPEPLFAEYDFLKKLLPLIVVIPLTSVPEVPPEPTVDGVPVVQLQAIGRVLKLSFFNVSCTVDPVGAIILNVLDVVSLKEAVLVVVK